MGSPHVLLITRDADSSAMYADWFAGAAGLRTTSVDSPYRARTVLTDDPPDVVLFDVTRFPDWEACAGLGQHPGAPPVVVHTGWVAEDGRFRQRAFAGGCAAFVAKPCHPRLLIAVLRRVLDGERRICIT